MLKVAHARFVHQGLGGSWIDLARGQFRVFRVHWAHVVVFGRHAATRIAQLQQNRVVHSHRDRLTHALVGVGFHAIDFGQLVGTDHDGRGRDDLVVDPAVQRIKDINELAFDRIGHVDLFGFGRGDKGRWVGAVIDVFDAVQKGPVAFVPPCVISVFDQHGFDAHFERFWQIGAGADGAGCILTRGVGVDDRRRIVGHARDQRNVGGRQVEAHGVTVENLDCTFQRFVGLWVDQRGKTARHRVPFERLVAPAGDVTRHVFGGEVVAVVPFDASADVQSVDGCVIRDFPAFQQLAGECAVILVVDQIFLPAAREVCDLRPVIGAWVFEATHFLLNADGAACFGVGCGLSRCRHAEHCVGCGGRCAKGAGQRQEFAAADVVLSGGGGAVHDGLRHRLTGTG
mmetsp:Transcript_29106/g.56028  ORF Transcript_29106/g.56028 Transcript_29106/m.56028 type:complete len:399 (+) Transcript_29106:547-1743(+)